MYPESYYILHYLNGIFAYLPALPYCLYNGFFGGEKEIVIDLTLQELNTALDEALEDYDLATKWLDGKNRQSSDGKK